ncbi:MAG: DUF6851 domain-containing protein [Planctomycetota bacterium]
MKRRKTRSAERLEVRNLLAADLAVDTDSLTVEDSGAVVVGEASAADDAPVVSNDGILEATETASEVADMQTDVVLEWNDLFGDLLVADVENQNPGYASRAMAMFNLSIYDAVTLVNGDADDTFYDYSNQLSGLANNANAELTAAQAAYTVLSELYPGQQTMLDSMIDATLSSPGNTQETNASIALGTAIGEVVIEARADDGSDAVVEYTTTDGIGNFQVDPLNPEVAVWGPAWGDVETFAIDSAESFAPATTPAISSEEYADSYNEVQELGSVDSQTRTADQTEAGIFWAYDREGLGTPLSLYNDVLIEIATQQGNSLEENAALFAQTSVAMADAAIVAWHTKFDEEFWRPITAIREGDADGNDLTEGDADWTSLGAPDGGDDIVGFTPQFPTYISGHATFGGALFGAIQEFYGTDDISFELESEELAILLEDPELQEAYGLALDDATRQFDSLSEAMAENGRSRVYLGIHFDFDDLVGQEVGQAVAQTVATQFTVAEDDGFQGIGDANPNRRRMADSGRDIPGQPSGPQPVQGGQRPAPRGVQAERDAADPRRDQRRGGDRNQADAVDSAFRDLGEASFASPLAQNPLSNGLRNERRR